MFIMLMLLCIKCHVTDASNLFIMKMLKFQTKKKAQTNSKGMYGEPFSNKSGRETFVCMEGHLAINQDVRSFYVWRVI